MTTTDSKGAFVRKESSFRNTISLEEGAIYKPEANRYHLYVSYACPWAHRTIILRSLKGLEDVISISVADQLLEDQGWVFNATLPGSTLDTVNGYSHIRSLYYRTDPAYSGRFTVPVLWDKKTSTIVNNESSEIIRILNSSFNNLAKNPKLDLYPESKRKEIDEINELVYTHVNNGVYKAGFAQSQSAYDEAFESLFKQLDYLEDRLSKSRYLVGSELTESDIRLFVTLIRFDAVYFGHFKCNKRMIRDYPNLSDFLRELYQNPLIQPTFLPLKPTIGVDFVHKDVMVNDKMVTLQIWDTSGMERFRSLEISYYRGSDCCILVFDVTKEKTLHDLKTWRNDFIQKTDISNPENFPFVVLGNKIDEADKRIVTEKMAHNWCKEIGGNIFYFDTSAKDNTNIDLAFQTVSRISIQNTIPNTDSPPEELVISYKEESKPCCAT
eukprot:gene6722-8332_t